VPAESFSSRTSGCRRHVSVAPHGLSLGVSVVVLSLPAGPAAVALPGGVHGGEYSARFSSGIACIFNVDSEGTSGSVRALLLPHGEGHGLDCARALPLYGLGDPCVQRAVACLLPLARSAASASAPLSLHGDRGEPTVARGMLDRLAAHPIALPVCTRSAAAAAVVASTCPWPCLFGTVLRGSQRGLRL
jgi:hypothetical protein